MFQAYGWAKLGEVQDLTALREAIARAAVEGWVEFQLIPSLNWAGTAVTVAACRNHRYEPVIDVFRWLAMTFEDAYGVLFVRDEESEHDNQFRVWRLARGTLVELADPFLSPCVPVIELPYVPSTE